MMMIHLRIVLLVEERGCCTRGRTHRNRPVMYDDKQNETQGVAFHEVFTVVEQDIVLL